MLKYKSIVEGSLNVTSICNLNSLNLYLAYDSIKRILSHGENSMSTNIIFNE